MSWLIRPLLLLVFFAAAFQSLTALKFDKFCDVRQPWKVHLLIFLLSLGLAALCTMGVELLMPGGLMLV